MASSESRVVSLSGAPWVGLFGALLALVGGGLLVQGLLSLEQLLHGLREYGASYLTSEVSLFTFGGALVLVLGLALLVFGPKGVTVDLDRAEATLTRGLLPRLPFKTVPLSQVGLRIGAQRMFRAGRVWYHYELWIDLPPVIKIGDSRALDAIRSRAAELGQTLGCTVREQL